MSQLPVSIAVALVAFGFSSAPVAAGALSGLGGTAAWAVAGLNETGSLLVWGTLLAVVARTLARRPRRG